MRDALGLMLASVGAAVVIAAVWFWTSSPRADLAVAATVSYDAAARTATLTPASPLAAGSAYTARVHGGPTGARVTDVAGNALAANASDSWVTDTTVAQPRDELARLGIDTVAHRIEGDLQGAPRTTFVDVKLVTRRSTSPPRAGQA